MNLKLIELIAQIAIEVGEHVIPPIIDALRDCSDEQKKEISKQVNEKILAQK